MRHPGFPIRHHHHRRQQRGATLLVVVALLLGMGLMSLTAFFLSRGQYQLVGNIQHLQQAFIRAEATSAAAEQWLGVSTNSQSPGFAAYDTSLKGLYPAGQLAALGRDPASMTWNDSNSIASADGRYLIEQLSRGVKLPGASVQLGQRSSGSCKSVDLFRVVANSGSTRGSSRLIETMFATDGCY
ncbi:hypothetical protein [Piscinibacter sakaiensis]|uniref:hypothetical protein n=1 Tax=Piscinibacter sakaiensis TaxID=1547922 RepID=UPI003AB0013D